MIKDGLVDEEDKVHHATVIPFQDAKASTEKNEGSLVFDEVRVYEEENH